MKIVLINASNIGSTGTIMREIAEEAKKEGYKCYVCYPQSRTNAHKYQKGDIFIGNRITRNIGLFFSEILGLDVVSNFFSTFLFVMWLLRIRPNVIHLHNLHGSYINLPLLFLYLKASRVKVIWTLHDCWAFTGHCPHFVVEKCEKWKTRCHHCPKYHEYPSCIYDNSRMLFWMKRKLFSSIKILIITPSEWLASQVKQSFLGKNEIRVIHNGIDTDVFKPFFNKNELNPIRILVMPNTCNDDTVYSDIIKLRQLLPHFFVITMVGLTNDQIPFLPEGIVGYDCRLPKEELADMYNKADIILNPTYIETCPTLNMKTMARNALVVSYNSNGTPEIFNNKTKRIIKTKNVVELSQSIMQLKIASEIKLACRKRAIDYFKKEILCNSQEDLYLRLIELSRGGKIILLAVASIWTEFKGLEDYLKLSRELPEDFVLIMVGHLPESTSLPSNVINIPRVFSSQLLSAIYNISDVLLSLSRGETFGMTIAEAISCGIPVIVYGNTAQTELVTEDCGIIVEDGNVRKVLDAIIKLASDNMYIKNNSTSYDFNKLSNYKKYIDLYTA